MAEDKAKEEEARLKEKSFLNIWPDKHAELRAKLKSVTGEEALTMVEEQGAVLLDVRLSKEYEAETVEGAIHVPVSIPADTWQERAAGWLLSLRQTSKANPNFRKDALEKLPLDKPIIIVCEKGGNLAPILISEGYSQMVDSQYTMSLKAAYELYEAGFKDLYFIDRGIDRWPGNWVQDPLDQFD